MTKKFHMSLSVEGALSNRKKITYMQDDNGRRVSDAEARAFLMQCIAEGKKLIPMGKECDGFSYETGCPGHEIK